MRATVQWLVSQFPDIHMEIESIIAEGDLVAARVLSTGTSLGTVGGAPPPTGKSFAARQSHWFRTQTANSPSTGRPATTYRRCSKSACSSAPGRWQADTAAFRVLLPQQSRRLP